MSLESFIIVPGLVIFRNMMLFLSGQFSWVKSKQATKHRQRDPPLPCLSAACTVLCVCILSRRQLLSVALQAAALRSQTWLRLSCLCTAFWRQLQSLLNGKKIGRGSFVDVYMCTRCVCCFGFTWPEHFYYDDGSVKVKHSKRRSEPSFCIITHILWCVFVNVHYRQHAPINKKFFSYINIVQQTEYESAFRRSDRALLLTVDLLHLTSTRCYSSEVRILWHVKISIEEIDVSHLVGWQPLFSHSGRSKRISTFLSTEVELDMLVTFTVYVLIASEF